MKKLLIISLLLLPTQVFGAIAFDAVSNGHTTDTTLTFAHTMSSSAGGYLVCGVAPNNDVNDITGVAYNGAAMTQYELVNSSGGSHQYFFGLANPSSGTNNVVVSRSSSAEMTAICSSYIGALGGLDAHGQNIQSGTQTSLTTTATSIADNSWAILLFGWQRAPGSFVGMTGRTNNNQYYVADTNAVIHPAGTHDMTYSFASCSDQCMSAIWLTLSPTAPITPISSQDLIAFSDE